MKLPHLVPLLAILLCARPVLAAPAGTHLEEIARIESGGDHAAVGAAGERGAWQMSRAAWTHVNDLRRKRGATRHPWRAAHAPETAREYVAEYLAWLQGRFTAARGRPPTDAETYALWNLGFAGFQRRGFDLQRCPEITRRGAARMTEGKP